MNKVLMFVTKIMQILPFARNIYQESRSFQFIKLWKYFRSFATQTSSLQKLCTGIITRIRGRDVPTAAESSCPSSLIIYGTTEKRRS